jgi:hypothetical protein
MINLCNFRSGRSSSTQTPSINTTTRVSSSTLGRRLNKVCQIPPNFCN